MSLLLNQIIEHARTNDDVDIWDLGLDAGIPTGFTGFDIMTSTIEKDEFRKRNRLSGGLFPKVYTIVGESGTGKSTLISQLVSSSINNFKSLYGQEGGDVFIFDTEGFHTPTRFGELSGWSDEYLFEKLYLDKETFTPSKIFNIVRKIAETKENSKEFFKINSKFSTLDNRKHEIYIPTYIIIDSIVNMTEVNEFEHTKGGDLKDTELVSNMEGMLNAKNNTNFLKKIKSYLVKYNITVILVNHIVDRPNINPYEKVNRDIPWLPANKTLKGGKQMFFQTAFLPRLEFVKNHTREKDQEFGPKIHGQINSITFWKNKNGIENVTYPMVFDSRMGYIAELSDFEFLQNVGYGLVGNSGSCYLEILPEIKLNKKTLFDACTENPMIARAIQFTTKLYLIYKYIKRTTPIEMSKFSELSLKDRLKLIYCYTIDYPRFIIEGNKIKAEHIKQILESDLYFGDTSRRFIDKDTFDTIENRKKGYTRFLSNVGLSDYKIYKKSKNKDNYLYPQKSV